MMERVSYRRLLNAKLVIEELLQLSPAPTARLAAQIARNARLVNQALRDFDAAHKVMMKPYQNDAGKINLDQLEAKTRTALDAEFEELLDMEIEIDLHPLPITEIEHVEEARPGFEIPVLAFYVADFMFSEDGG